MFHLFSDVFPPLVTHGVDSIAFKHDNFLIYLKSLIYCAMCLECKSGMRWLIWKLKAPSRLEASINFNSKPFVTT